MKTTFITIFMFIGFFVFGQEIEYKGDNYTVKKGLIYKDGKDVTNELSELDRASIIASFNTEKALIKVSEEIELAEDNERKLRRAEKEQTRLEKKQKKAERALKRKERAKDAFAKEEKRHKKSVKKYNRLKRKGKLSPKEEADWLEKIEKQKKDMKKAKRKFKRS